MVEVVGDSILNFLRGRAISLVREYADRGFSFGYLAGPEKRYTEPNELPDPIHIRGPSVGRHVHDFARKLNMTFNGPDCYGHYKGAAVLKNTAGVDLKVPVELWDTNFPAPSN